MNSTREDFLVAERYTRLEDRFLVMGRSAYEPDRFQVHVLPLAPIHAEVVPKDHTVILQGPEYRLICRVKDARELRRFLEAAAGTLMPDVLPES